MGLMICENEPGHDRATRDGAENKFNTLRDTIALDWKTGLENLCLSLYRSIWCSIIRTGGGCSLYQTKYATYIQIYDLRFKGRI